ncbi:glycosyltransferase family 9 protein [Geothrix sp. 21YS21S-2]|uniref:glycosyltransferase family 9 protein n=1 Tax=Geothrix sp. 21YS21S-2 TaxID=3068893 RepID=UPI0027BAC457|nr:hypothetical protein [Geothrix sp. 21YS21S-2]
MIAFFLPNGIGDTLMAIPALRRLAAVEGANALTVVISSKLHRPLLTKFVGEKIRTIERYDGKPFPHVRLFLKLLFSRAKVIYAPMLSRKPMHLLFFLLMGKKVVVPRGFLGRNLLGLVRSRASLETFPGHQVNFFVQFLAEQDPRVDAAPVDPGELSLPRPEPVPPVDHALPRRFRVALGISCGGLERHKVPTAGTFAKLINAIEKRIPVHTVLIGIPSDLPLIEAFMAEMDHPEHVEKVIGLPLEDLFRELQTCDLGISGTTGQGHIMAVAGLPMLVVAGVTEPFESGPYTRRGADLRHRLACGPCYQEGYRSGCGAIQCMETLDLEEGAELAYKLLMDPEFGLDWQARNLKRFPVLIESIKGIHAVLPEVPGK